jgi:hypothetical protein
MLSAFNTLVWQKGSNAAAVSAAADATHDAPRILQAYATARAARFEHGEYGDGE